jgi:hypothetical protein
MGISQDWGGFGHDPLTEAQISKIVAAFPRLQMKQRFTRDVCRIVESRPVLLTTISRVISASASCLAITRPSTVDFLLNSPFEE